MRLQAPPMLKRCFKATGPALVEQRPCLSKPILSEVPRLDIKRPSDQRDRCWRRQVSALGETPQMPRRDPRSRRINFLGRTMKHAQTDAAGLLQLGERIMKRTICDGRRETSTIARDCTGRTGSQTTLSPTNRPLHGPRCPEPARFRISWPVENSPSCRTTPPAATSSSTANTRSRAPSPKTPTSRRTPRPTQVRNALRDLAFAGVIDGADGCWCSPTSDDVRLRTGPPTACSAVSRLSRHESSCAASYACYPAA